MVGASASGTSGTPSIILEPSDRLERVVERVDLQQSKQYSVSVSVAAAAGRRC